MLTGHASLVSVIIPTYNRWEYLRQTIESVLGQTYPNVEIIVVDDGSTDETPDGLQVYGDRIRVITQTNQGGTAARNSGIKVATGAYLTFLDHDDLMLPAKLERQIALLEAHPGLGAAHCRWEYIDPQGKVLDKIGPLPEGNLHSALILGCFLWSGAPVVRRTFIEQVGGFDTSIWSSDWDIWLRLSAVDCVFGCVQEVLGAYRIMPDSTMSDVARTEVMDVRLLDKAFADPFHVPRSILALKDQVYANWRFWLSRRYYATGSPTDGKRNLAEALNLYPGLLTNRDEFLETLCNEALDVRVSDPFAFVEVVFSNLPPNGQSIQSSRSFVESQVHIGLAFRAYAEGNSVIGGNHIRQALNLQPELAEYFARRCAAAAMRLPVKPLKFVQSVLEGLPPEAEGLKALRSRLISDVAIAAAFESHFSGRHGEAGRQILNALWYRPAWVKNKGVLSVLGHSIPKLLTSD